MEKINIAELIKDCPKGMELDCTIWNSEAKVFLERVLNDDFVYPIEVIVKYNNVEYLKSFNKYGAFNDLPYCECVIFPKGKTTWEGFVPPCKFKDGDIVYTRCDDGDEYIFIFKNITNNTHVNSYIHLKGDDLRVIKVWLTNCDDKYLRLATEEEKAKLFQAIRDYGCKWNTETKTLEKFVEQKFKVGDEIVNRNSISNSWIVNSVSSEYYGLKLPKGSEEIGVLPVSEQDNYELVSNKFDISTLKPFESRVLVRDTNTEKWKSTFWGFYDIDNARNYPFECCGTSFNQCIPYEGNEHLLGKTDDCDEYYKTWE